MAKNATGTWRLRSRTKTHSIEFGTGTSDLLEAKRVAKNHLEETAAKRRSKGSETVEDATKLYLEMPKRCSPIAAEHNVGRLKRMIALTWGKTLAQVKLSEIGPKLWKEFMAKKQGGKLDLSTRRVENAAINSAVRQACSIFIPALRPIYAEHKMIVPEDATVVQWLPMIKAPPPTADIDNMDSSIEELATIALDMYLCLGLARWAGLRRAEIKACRREWLQEDRGQLFVHLHDRPEEGYLTKTGAIYRAMVINLDFAKTLLSIPKGMLIVNPSTTDRDGWFEREPQNWLRPYTGKAKKPLHRLRGLYADDVRRITEEAIHARSAAIKAASQNLGHTRRCLKTLQWLPYLSQSMTEANWMRARKWEASLSLRVLAEAHRFRRQK